MSKELANLKYILLPGKLPPHSEALPIYNQVYTYWSQFWSHYWKNFGESPKEEHLALGKKKYLSPDFLRQDFISALVDGNEVVAFQLHTVFDLNQKSVQDLSYFDIHNDFSMMFLKQRNVQTALSFEYYGVHPAWRKDKVGQWILGPILTMCGMKLVEELNLDVGLATTRVATRVNEMGYTLGWECVQKNVDYHGDTCDLIATFPHTLPDNIPSDFKLWFSHFWEKRQDYTQRTLNKAHRRAA
jgi:hypothetical protein